MVYASGKGVIAGLTVYLINGYSTAKREIGTEPS